MQNIFTCVLAEKKPFDKLAKCLLPSEQKSCSPTRCTPSLCFINLRETSTVDRYLSQAVTTLLLANFLGFFFFKSHVASCSYDRDIFSPP